VEVTDVQQVERSTGDAIDVVIAWVDGRNPQHRAKRERYLADPGGDAKPKRAAHIEQRFSDNDEIRFCLRSIHNYAPCVHTIWLVTDNQVPTAIDRRRAERDNIRLVDHREIFRGYEQLLPTFNSLSGSDRRSYRVRATCSRNRVTAVTRKQLQGQFVRQGAILLVAATLTADSARPGRSCREHRRGTGGLTSSSTASARDFP
jgi:hypothetical protein